MGTFLLTFALVTNGMMNKQKKIALCGLFSAIAIAIAFAESISGVNALIPIPGVKLGLANIAVIGAVIFIEKKYGFAVMLIRCLVMLFIFGNVSGFIISLCGGCFAFASVCFMIRLGGSFCSLIGISSVGAFCHAVGQLVAVAVLTDASSVLVASPMVLFGSVLTGVVSGLCANAVYNSLGNRFLGGALS